MADVAPLRAGTLKRLMQHAYFSDWTNEQFKAVESQANLVSFGAGEPVLGLGDVQPYDYFLVNGQLSCKPAEGLARSIDAADLDANFPIAHIRPALYEVTAETEVKVVRFEAAALKRQTAVPTSARFDPSGAVVGGSWRAHPLVEQLIGQLENHGIEIPAMPGIALRIRKAIQKPDFDMQAIATIISADPSITAALLKTANSAVFAGEASCDTLQAALMRLGIERVQNIVLAISTQRLFTSESPVIKKQLLKSWRHAVDIAAMCAVLAKHCEGMDPDRGLLIGLLHEIGCVPILGLANQHTDLWADLSLLNEILDVFAPELSAQVLQAWGFSDVFSNAARQQSQWFRDEQDAVDYGDLVVVAHLHSLVKDRQFKQLPRLDDVPAFRKVTGGDIGPAISLKILDDARTQVAEIRSLLQ